jgi:phosphoribosylanthranilate isomerase
MPARSFRIKVCGVTHADDFVAAAIAGADAVGLNFYPRSPRFVDEDARNVLQQALAAPDKLRFILNRKVEKIGVFVNARDQEIQQCIDDCSLDAIQLHGDEPPQFLAQLPSHVPVIRARRVDDRGVAAIAEDLEACEAAGRLPDAVLVDAITPGRYGGTGETVSWAGLADYPKWLGEVPLILAGGLTPENVAEAIRIVRPAGVDVASGVEKSPGVKDHDKVRRFVEAAKSAFAAL